MKLRYAYSAGAALEVEVPDDLNLNAFEFALAVDLAGPVHARSILDGGEHLTDVAAAAVIHARLTRDHPLGPREWNALRDAITGEAELMVVDS